MSLRNLGTRLIRYIPKNRAFSSAAARRVTGVGIGGLLASGLGSYIAYDITKRGGLSSAPGFVLHASTLPQPQPNVISENKKHALFLWIHVRPGCDPKACAKVVANLKQHVDVVSPPDSCDEEDEIWAGVGFGPNFYSQVTGKKTLKSYIYPHRKGFLGDMPSTGGDIFIHAKCNTMSKLFELCQRISNSLPANAVDSFSDVYSFVYQNNRDLSGFIDGTENPAGDEDRYNVAVEKSTGGSYCITQKWIHKLDVIGGEKDKTLEAWIGRSKSDSMELKRKSGTSHVARMVGGEGFEQESKFEIVRQSMPYGNLSDHAGLFFIGFAESPENFEFMLDRMVGAAADGQSDDVMRLTRCVSGNYWYFPAPHELRKMA